MGERTVRMVLRLNPNRSIVMLFQRNRIQVAGTFIALDFGMFEFASRKRLTFQIAEPFRAHCVGDGSFSQLFPDGIDQP